MRILNRYQTIGARTPADEGAAGATDAGSPRNLIGTGEIYIARDGTWYHEGRPFQRRDLAKLFATVLRRDDDGSYWLKTPVETVRVHVADAPFVAEEMRAETRDGEQVISLRTNLDDWVEVGPDHALRVETDPETGEPAPYVHVRRGLEALVARSVFYQLAELAEAGSDDAGNEVYGAWSHGAFYPLGAAG